MALNYIAMDALTASANFLARVRQSLRLIAAYHRNAAAQDTTPEKKNWAYGVIDNARVSEIAEAMLSELISDGAIIASTDPTNDQEIPDANFKGLVEVYCFKYGS